MKIGLNIAVIGGPGAGKTTYIKDKLNQIKDGENWIYDPNEEYLEYDNQYLGLMHTKEFARITNKLAKYSKVIFEEATAFLRHGTSDANIIEMLTRKRHKRNIHVFVFHSFGSLPVWVLPYLDYLVLFETRDRTDLIEKKYSENPELLAAYLKQKRKGRFEYTTIKLK